MISIEAIKENTRLAILGLLEVANLEPGQVFVVGCSTSEVAGEHIGKAGSKEIAQAILNEALPLLKDKGIYFAAQCCEHLNRAIVIEKEAARKYGWEQVMAVPHERAGGSLATVAYQKLKEPILVETIQGHAGMDIGDTFIGMHLRPVVVPVRLPIKEIGKAHLTLARTRPKLIGGERARYC